MLTTKDTDCRDRTGWVDKRTDIDAGFFSKAEDTLLLAAVKKFAQEHKLPQDDLSWVHTRKPSKDKEHTYLRRLSTAVRS